MVDSIKKRMLRMFKRWLSATLPYQPMDGKKEVLDAEYLGGKWDYLRCLNELARFSVVAGYCHHFREKGTILEVGCGEGILQERLCPSKYSRYVGVDISTEAIERASRKQDGKTLFFREDARIYRPDERFDVIVFNECLEYFDDPLSILQRYEHFLAEDGIYVVSMFVGTDTVRTKRIWKMLESLYIAETQTQVSTARGYSWIVKVFKPSREKSDIPRLY
jgi:2-polyprenyl-3-methyl-5-hydroxy-6-metoxy-1,4-benzoquinol methylase